MMELACSSQGLAPGLLEAPGGFLWWYVDLLDDDRSGVVVIWSFGLPFLPGYADAARRGVLELPVDRPSLNISVYQKGALDFYLLQEFDRREVQWRQDSDSSCWQFGESTLRSEKIGADRIVDLDLVLDVPGMKQKTYFRLHGRGVDVTGDWDEKGPSSSADRELPEHDWRPLLCATTGRATIETVDTVETFSGRLYHDRNGGCLPLHELGIDWWAWGRLALKQREFVYFVLSGGDQRREAHFLMVGPDGVARRLPGCRVRGEKMTKNFGGLRSWKSVAIERGQEKWLTLRFDDPVDSGPFYQRSIIRGEDAAGESAQGIGEFCEPHRVDLRRHRPLVEMRVHRRGGGNSMWLPLFSGPRKGRLRRLIQTVLTGGGGL